MNETTKAFSDAFAAYIDAKRKLVKENVPYYIKVHPSYFNEFLNQSRNSDGTFSYTFSSDGSHYIYVNFLNEEYEVPLVLDHKVDTYEEVYQD